MVGKVRDRSSRQMSTDRVRDELPRHTRNGRLSRPVDVGDHDPIRGPEGRAEVLVQPLSARVAVRLKHCYHAPPGPRARGLERGLNFGRVVRVVVDDRDSANLAANLKSTLDALV